MRDAAGVVGGRAAHSVSAGTTLNACVESLLRDEQHHVAAERWRVAGGGVHCSARVSAATAVGCSATAAHAG